MVKIMNTRVKDILEDVVVVEATTLGDGLEPARSEEAMQIHIEGLPLPTALGRRQQ